MEVYEDISYDIAEIFSAAYRQYPPAQEKFGSMSIPRLQQLAGKYAVTARNYDPHAEIHEIQNFLKGVYKLVRSVLIVIIVLGLITGAGFWVSISRGVLEALGSMLQIPVYLLLGGPTVLAVVAGIVLLYAQLLSLNTFVVQILNRQLVIGMGDIVVRDEEKLVGYALWNSSLNGRAAVKLLAVFSVLRVFSATPWWVPYTYIKKSMERHIDVFDETDGTIQAMKRVYHRIRNRER